MSKKRVDNSQYAYSLMSSQVTQANRQYLPGRTNEPTGEAESLVGKLDLKSMGSRAGRESAKELEKKKAKIAASADAAASTSHVREGPNKRKAAQMTSSVAAHGDILLSEDLAYRPRTAETRQVYELMLSAVQKLVGDQTGEMIRSASDFVIVTLKDDVSFPKDLDKKHELETLFKSQIDSELFSQLLSLTSRITDYGPEDDDVNMDSNVDAKAELDEDGVALMFDEADEEEEEDNFRDEEAATDSEAEESDEDASAALNDTIGADDMEVDQTAADEIVLGSKSKVNGRSAKDKSKLDPLDINAFWLRQLISTVYTDPLVVAAKEEAALSALGSGATIHECESSLVELFEYSNFDLVTTLLANRDVIYWCTKLGRADDNEKINIRVAMREKGVGSILRALEHRGDSKTQPTGDVNVRALQQQSQAAGSIVKQHKSVDLESMIFTEGGHLKSNKTVTLPPGSTRDVKKSYEEIRIPRPKAHSPDPKDMFPISSMPEWTRPAFGGMKNLYYIQSKVYPKSFLTDESFLVCAPTGAGKTNIALCAMLRAIDNARDPSSGEISLDSFKMIYVAPMKALVQEMVGSFSKRLAPFGVKVGELTGDSQLTKEQISEVQLIVTTPEKWDVITRKSNDLSYTNLVSLIIVDEIHLLHDDRGPVLESIIARTIRRSEQTRNEVRLVGLSATLPNYKDVATFLRVDPSCVFYFDATYRPCPLEQQYIGVTEKKAIKRLQVMNEVCYEKTLGATALRQQTIIFVHSRKETANTAKFIRDMALEKSTADSFINSDGQTYAILTKASENAKDQQLKDILPYGFACHHAGMDREDRTMVENLFYDKRISVLVSTATLAWGVNLPAHFVIIKGTQVYNPEKGAWSELSPQDVLQMLGRAGRPGFDSFGEGIIITNQSEMQYYLSLLNEQLPIESQLVAKLADNLNAEIVLGTIRSITEAVNWLGYTYLYVRMMKNKSLYGINDDYEEDDIALIQKRADIAHTASVMLEKTGLLRYNRQTGELHSTDLGRIASYYYITNASMATYKQHLRPNLTAIDLFRVFSLSNEFKLIPVRAEEKVEVARLMELVPIPVKESADEPTAKINVLLQTYISQRKLDKFVLLADMVFVQQSAGRILRAMFEICMKRGWAGPTKILLEMSKMVEKRMWNAMTPLRQFENCPVELIRKAEKRQFPWYRYFDLQPTELGELLGMPKSGVQIHKLVHKFPKLELELSVLPITRSLLKVDLSILPDFEWDDKYHHGAETFWIFVEDVDGEILLYHDKFLLQKRYCNQEHPHLVNLTIPMTEPVPPNYFVTVVSDRWLHSETRIPISFRNLILPNLNPPHTKLLELQPLPPSAFNESAYESLYPDIQNFNQIQTQTFQALYSTNDSVLICAPPGSGKSTCAEFALYRMWNREGDEKRCVCIEPYEEMVEMRVREWSVKFSKLQGGKTVLGLTGDTTVDLREIKETAPDIIVATPEQWDKISRKWTTRSFVRQINLFIANEVQLIGAGDIGATYEVILSRARSVAVQSEFSTRIVALSVSLGNARDVGDWIGCPPQNVFNFSPSTRPLPLDISVQTFNIPHFPSLMITMSKPAYLSILEHAGGKPVIAFVPTRKQTYDTADDLIAHCSANNKPTQFLKINSEQLEPQLAHISDETVKETLRYGIAIYHEGMTKQDRLIVQRLYEAGAVQILIASKDVAWSLPVRSFLVIIFGVQFYFGQEHRYVDYAITDVLQMIGKACRPTKDDSSKCLFMVQQNRKDFFMKFLQDALPVESQLNFNLEDHLNAEIVNKTIESMTDAVNYSTWTYLYRRMTQNPNYYELSGTSHNERSTYLSEMMEKNISALADAHCIREDDENLTPENLGQIASYYYISAHTVKTFQTSFTAGTKLRGVLEIVAHSWEFEAIPVRKSEAALLMRLYDRLPVKLEQSRAQPESPYFKTHVLLQAHFARMPLSADLALDQAEILRKVLNLLSAAVDVMSTNTFLSATYAMDLSQMIVQSIWDHDSPLKQVPHFNASILAKCKASSVETVYDLSELEDDQRNSLLASLSKQQIRDVATFANAYPSIEIDATVEDEEELTSSDPVTVVVSLDPIGDDEDEDPEAIDPTVVAPLFPVKKLASWWIVIGSTRTKVLYAIKKVTITKRQSYKMDLADVPAGDHELKVQLICDSYAGADAVKSINIKVAQGDDDDEEDGDEEMEE